MKEDEIFNEKFADLALKLFRKTTECSSKKGTANQNLFLSPASISVAIAMVYVGADGKTKQQVNENLFGRLNDKIILGNLEALCKFMHKPANGFMLSLANRAFVQKSFKILPSYQNVLHEHFHSDILPLDFLHDSKRVLQIINDWVAEITTRKIETLFEDMDPEVKLVLANAIYFKGDWLLKFDPAATIEKPFHISDNQSKIVNMMRTCDHFLYYSNDAYQALGLSYVNKDLFMLFLLPKERFGLNTLECQLTGKYLMEMLDSMTETEVQVHIPKFTLETSVDLVRILSDLGADDMFSTGANFSKITEAGQLYVSDIVHKAFIEINEHGTEAAGATGIKMMLRSAPFYERFIADHPFMFAVVKKSSKTLLFLGHFYG